jgi:GNAT superfamily N-acetyltransferase
MSRHVKILISSEELASRGEQKMRIEQLSQEKLADAIKLVHKIFAYEASWDNPPGTFLRASLHPEENKELLQERGIRRLEYYALQDEKTDRVIGVIGQYENSEDSPDIVWVGWFCVDPDFQGQKLGELLLTWNMQNAREKGYKTMKLYTSDHPREAKAQGLYNKLGFEINRVQSIPDTQYNLLYRERPL